MSDPRILKYMAVITKNAAVKEWISAARKEVPYYFGF